MTSAKVQMAKMKRSLSEWLRYRDMNTAAGLTADQATDRASTEQTLASRLRALLAEAYPGSSLPSDAPSLARIVIAGSVPPTVTAPEPQGIWPLLILAGAGALVLMSAVSSWADYAKERERYECIEKYGAWKCDPSGTAIKYGVVLGVGFVAWKFLGLGDLVRGLTGGRRKRR